MAKEMQQLYVLFLWHLHQPIYKMANSNIYILPWIRLHSIKAYRDMAVTCLSYPDVGMTFNLTPSLMHQLEDYINHRAEDYYETISRKKPEELSTLERNFIIDNFFQANWPTMIHLYPGYKRLLAIKEKNQYELFTNQDILDLQMWFNLAWFGYSAKEHYSVIQEMIKKDHNFNQDEKISILDLHYTIMAEILPLYQKIALETKSEISTTPFYHPILPLIYDTETAKRCMPQFARPNRFSFPEDARAHIQMAKSLYKKYFSEAPLGFWPAEGSVSPEIANLFIDEKVAWIATDEEILYHSDGGTHHNLFDAYSYSGNSGKISIFFRDKGLSDAIGFRYSKMHTNEALQEFFSNLRSIQSHAENHQVAIILDGENPWEYYFDGGQSFLKGIYEGLRQSDQLRAVSMSNSLKSNTRTKDIKDLYSASWIYGNFQIWIGSAEDNKAWNYLLSVRNKIEEKKNNGLSGQALAKALEYIYVSEGSDWFWWYGDDFQSLTKKDFDAIFRSYLIAAWESLGEQVPLWLLDPIMIFPQKSLESPKEFLFPKIDGLQSDYFEWLGSIPYQTKKSGSAMFHADHIVQEIAYGFNQEELFIKISFFFHLLAPNSQIKIKLFKHSGAQVGNDLNGTHFEMQFSLESHVLQKVPVICHTPERKELGQARAAMKEFLECAIPFKAVSANTDETIEFGIELIQGNETREFHPVSGLFKILVPDESFLTANWFI